MHTSAMPAHVPAPAPASLLGGRVNTLKVLSMKLEVTTRPRVGQTAIPNPAPQLVAKVGSGTRVATSTAMRGEKGDDICNEHMGGNADTRSGGGGVTSLQHFNAHVRFSAIKSQRNLMLDARCSKQARCRGPFVDWDYSCGLYTERPRMKAYPKPWLWLQLTQSAVAIKRAHKTAQTLHMLFVFCCCRDSYCRL